MFLGLVLVVSCCSPGAVAELYAAAGWFLAGARRRDLIQTARDLSAGNGTSAAVAAKYLLGSVVTRQK